MKKIFAVLVPLTFVATLTSCSGSDASPDSTVASTSAPIAEEPNAKVAGPVEISVTVGTDSSKDRVEEVALGSQVSVTLTNPNADDEFHLHGYDLTPGDTPKGEAAVITFTADTAGEFEIESHITEEVLVTISVK